MTLSQPLWFGARLPASSRSKGVKYWGASSFAAQFLLSVAVDSRWMVGDSF